MQNKQRLALVTGASYGIGRAVAVGLARNGFDLVITARSKQLLEETAVAAHLSGRRIEAIPADLSQSADIKKLVDAINTQSNSLSAFIHCASGKTNPETDAELSTTPDETIDDIINTTVGGTIRLTKQLLPLLQTGAPSNIVFISSDWALKGSHGPSVFSAAKAAVGQLGHSLRRGLAAHNISMTVIYPGDVASFDVDWTEPKWQLDDSLDKVKAELGISRIPLVDVVESVIFVLSRKMCRVEEVWIAPLDPEYDY